MCGCWGMRREWGGRYPWEYRTEYNFVERNLWGKMTAKWGIHAGPGNACEEDQWGNPSCDELVNGWRGGEGGKEGGDALLFFLLCPS